MLATPQKTKSAVTSLKNKDMAESKNSISMRLISFLLSKGNIDKAESIYNWLIYGDLPIKDRINNPEKYV